MASNTHTQSPSPAPATTTTTSSAAGTRAKPHVPNSVNNHESESESEPESRSKSKEAPHPPSPDRHTLTTPTRRPPRARPLASGSGSPVGDGHYSAHLRPVLDEPNAFVSQNKPASNTYIPIYIRTTRSTIYLSSLLSLPAPCMHAPAS